jgi:U32 family peptidase
MKPELLSPAGSYDAAIAAFQYGADAVYLGLKSFSARAEADNSTFEELALLSAYARTFTPAKKIYITLNTLLTNSELPDFFKMLELAEELQPDGVIVQDIGAARVIRRHFPEIEMHASTQMAAHSIDDVMALRDMGFRRVVTARELSLQEIEAIVSHCGIEIEMFIHGALCYSYSGLCLFSAMTTGRSGNRGQCAYCCRHPFSYSSNSIGHPFSMKDLALLPILDQVIATGVHSLKIEGRMKNPLYVACVTSAYRRKLDGKLTPRDEREATEEIQTVFSRPWTTLYSVSTSQQPDAVIDSKTIGHRGALIGKVLSVDSDNVHNQWLYFKTTRTLKKFDGIQIDIRGMSRPFGFSIRSMRRHGEKYETLCAPADSYIEILITGQPVPFIAPSIPIYCSASQEVQQKYRFKRPRPADLNTGIPLQICVTLKEDGLLMQGCSTTTGDTAEVSVNSKLHPADNPVLSATAVRKACSKLGGTRWYADSVRLLDDKRLFAPPALLNKARRDLVVALEKERAQRLDCRFTAYATSFKALHTSATAPIAPKVTITLKLHISAVLPLSDSVAKCDRLVVEIDERAPELLLEKIELLRGAVPKTELVMPALPLIIRADSRTALQHNIRQLAQYGYTQWETPGLAGYRMLRNCGIKPISADWTLYAGNSEAARQLHEMDFFSHVTSPESDFQTLYPSSEKLCENELLIFQHTPLYISATPPLAEIKANAHWIELQNLAGADLRVWRKENLWITIAAKPLDRSALIRQALKLGIHRFRIDYSWNMPQAVANNPQVPVESHHFSIFNP